MTSARVVDQEWITRAMAGDPVMIAPGEVVPSPDQTRVNFDEDYLRELAASILGVGGLLYPIIVWRRPDNVIELIAGECRLRSVRDILRWREIKAIFFQGNAKQRALICGIENLKRRNLDAMEWARYYVRLRDGHGMTGADIARELGVSDFTVDSRLGVADELSPEIHGWIASGHLAITTAYMKLVKPLRTGKLQESDVRRVAREIINRKHHGATAEERAREGASKAELTGRYKARVASEPKHRLHTILGLRTRANAARATLDSILMSVETETGRAAFEQLLSGKLSAESCAEVAKDLRWLARVAGDLAQLFKPAAHGAVGLGVRRPTAEVLAKREAGVGLDQPPPPALPAAPRLHRAVARPTVPKAQPAPEPRPAPRPVAPAAPRALPTPQPVKPVVLPAGNYKFIKRVLEAMFPLKGDNGLVVLNVELLGKALACGVSSVQSHALTALEITVAIWEVDPAAVPEGDGRELLEVVRRLRTNGPFGAVGLPIFIQRLRGMASVQRAAVDLSSL